MGEDCVITDIKLGLAYQNTVHVLFEIGSEPRIVQDNLGLVGNPFPFCTGDDIVESGAKYRKVVDELKPGWYTFLRHLSYERIN